MALIPTLVGQMSESKDRAGGQLSDIQAQLERAIDQSDDEKQRYHARKAAQRVVFALESE